MGNPGYGVWFPQPAGRIATGRTGRAMVGFVNDIIRWCHAFERTETLRR